jgi:hypothetical protein
MTRSLRAAVLVIALLAGSAAGADAAVLTTGTLTNASGAASSGQVRVYAFGLPSAGESEHAMTLLGTAAAGADGAFSVVATDEAQLSRLAAARGGWLDLTAVGDTPGGQAQWGFTVFVDRPRGTAARVSSVDSVRDTGGVAHAATATTSAPRIRLHATHTVPFALASQFGRCDTKLTTRKPQSETKWAIVGEINNAYNDGTVGTFAYARQKSAETSFGIAQTPDGATFTISGENAITDKGSITFPAATKRYSRKLRTQFEFTKYQVRASSCAVWETEIRATSWKAGTDSTIKQDGLDKCDPAKVTHYEGGGKFDRETSKATRYSRAVEAFGVNLTSTSGFSKNVTLHYDFGGPLSKWHYVCGPDGQQSAMESGRVFSGTRK